MREACSANYVDIIKESLSSDHIHLFLSVPLHLSVLKIVQYIRGKTSRKLRQEFSHLRKRYWEQHMWSRGYFVITAGDINAEDVRRYTEAQEEHHKAENFRISEF